MKIRRITKLAAAGMAAASLSLFAFGAPAGAANGVQPVTFDVSSGSLALAQTPSAAILLVEDTPIDMPVTTVTDGRNAFDRSGAWTVTAVASDLTVVNEATIPAADIALEQSGSFTSGSGTVGTDGLVSASANSIDSVYTYTPTAELAIQLHPYSGSYNGTITQTVV